MSCWLRAQAENGHKCAKRSYSWLDSPRDLNEPYLLRHCSQVFTRAFSQRFSPSSIARLQDTWTIRGWNAVAVTYPRSSCHSDHADQLLGATVRVSPWTTSNSFLPPSEEAEAQVNRRLLGAAVSVGSAPAVSCVSCPPFMLKKQPAELTLNVAVSPGSTVLLSAPWVETVVEPALE